MNNRLKRYNCKCSSGVHPIILSKKENQNGRNYILQRHYENYSFCIRLSSLRRIDMGMLNALQIK